MGAIASVADPEWRPLGFVTPVIHDKLCVQGFMQNGFFPTQVVGRSSVDRPSGTGRYHGAIRLGEHWAGSFRSGASHDLGWEEPILHETLHTQFVVDNGGNKTKWAPFWVSYGGDGTHYTSELMGEQELSFEEGLGTYYGMVRNHPTGYNSVLQFLARTDERYIIESRSVLAGSAEIWNAPHTEVPKPLTLLPPSERTGSYVWRFYRWRDVPGWYLMFSESTSTAFHLLFWHKVNNNPDQAFDYIFGTSRTISHDIHQRFLTYAVNRLSLQMETYAATPPGQAAKTAGTLTSSMFPFALLDILTHFGMTEAQYKQDCDRNHPDRNPRAYTEYCARRNAVKTLVKPYLHRNPIRMQDAVDAANHYFQAADTILTPNP